MTKKSNKRKKTSKGSVMSGDDTGKSKSPPKSNIHENRTIQKNNSDK